MANYLIINLADPGGLGAISSLKAGVTAKRARTGLAALVKGVNTTDAVDAFDLLKKDITGQLQRNDPNLLELRTKCQNAKKIYLATHGVPTDVDNAFASATGDVALCNVEQLAKLVLAIFPNKDKQYRLSLVMCYGGRTSNYRAANIDHQGQIPITDIQTSFAYKLYNRIARHRNIRMTARTGAVAYDASTGVSQVEQEASIDARIDKEAFLRQSHIIPAMNAYKARRSAAAAGGNASYDAFTKLQNTFESNPGKVASNAEETDIKAYTDIIRIKQEYQEFMDANTDRAKYGKLVYRYTGGGMTIYSYYADDGKPLLLYSGPMT